VKVELICLAIILWLLLSLVTSCQNRSKPFQDSMKRWREHREQKRQVIDERDHQGDVPDDHHERRRHERRRLFPRGPECEA
jgi:uncharacterized membrane protein